MPQTYPRIAARLTRLVLAALGTALVLGVAGYFPTKALAGAGRMAGLPVGIGVSLVASIGGSIALVVSLGGKPVNAPVAVMLGTAVRFMIVLGATAALLLSGWLDRVVFVVWVAISYMVMLLVDTIVAVRMMAAVREDQP
jgi:hypothetical protein